MFTLNLDRDEILMNIAVDYPIRLKDIIFNFIGNMFTFAGGDIASKVFLTLTKDVLYIRYIGRCTIGYANEVRNLVQIPLNELKEFSVEIVDGMENLHMGANKKEFHF